MPQWSRGGLNASIDMPQRRRLKSGTAIAPFSGQRKRGGRCAAPRIYRFLGFPAFDGLIDWDFTHPNKIAELTSGLATAWKVDPADHTRWLFTLRQGVKFTDGTDVTSDVIVWNLQRLYDEKSPQFDPAASAIVRSFVNMLARWQKVDDHTIAIYKIAIQLFSLHGSQYPDRQFDRMGEFGPQLARISVPW